LNTPNHAAPYQPLAKIYKRRYPFRLSVPSFVYPDTWAANARMLGPYVDEIELLFFESKPTDCLPSRKELDELRAISKDFSLGYNIHLPTDVSLTAQERPDRSNALDAIRRVVDLTLHLNPSSWTLHIPYDCSKETGTDVRVWQGHAREALEKLIGEGIPPRLLAIENLDYPFDRVRDLVLDLDLSICMDAGHLILCGQDIAAFYRENVDRIPVLHLHGVRDGRDHLPLTKLSKRDGLAAFEILESFSETLSVEVFSFEHLTSSLVWLEKAVNQES
jgi:sugar phosphate isomerase/epimerase